MSDRAPWWKGERGEWYVVAQGLLFIAIAVAPSMEPSSLGPWPVSIARPAAGAGIVMLLEGAALAVWGLMSLGRLNLTALPYPTDSARLVEDGPYAIVRHPIYSGLIVAAFGWSLVMQSVLGLIFSAALFVLFDLKSRKEERWLIERFPEYAEYRTRVKKLLPFIY